MTNIFLKENHYTSQKTEKKININIQPNDVKWHLQACQGNLRLKSLIN